MRSQIIKNRTIPGRRSRAITRALIGGLASAAALLVLASCVNPLLKLKAASVAPPSFSPAGGVFGTDQSIQLKAATSGATIYYTTDGKTPTTSSTKYSGAITIAGNGTEETVKAIAVSGGDSSAVVSALFSINYSIGGTSTLTSPSFSPTAGVYTAAPSGGVTLSGPSGASIYYTTNGTTPSAANGTLYSGPITIANTNGTTTTLKAISAQSGLISSPVVSATYQINNSQVSTPQFSISGGLYTADQTGITVTVPSAPAGTTIYYTVTNTTVGTTPTTGSTAYTGPLSVTGNGTIQTIEVMAAAPGYTNSTVATETYVINYPQLTAPTFSPTPGPYLNNQTNITISVPSAPAGTTIYYTSGYAGTTPTTSSTVYSTPLSATGVGTSTTFEAIATAPGYSQSVVTVATFAISSPTLTFALSGTLTVPLDATQVTAKLWGAGGAAGYAGGAGGGGGYAQTVLTVAGGQQFTITVGAGAGLVDACGSGYQTGGSGGGMSAISDASGYYAIAGGGGGGGHSGGGAGGAGGQNGAPGAGGKSASPGGGSGGTGTGTAPVSGGTGGVGGGGVSWGTSGGVIKGGVGGGYTYAGWGGQGYGGGGGGYGGTAGTAGGGGGGNYGLTTQVGNFQTPGNSTDPALPAGDAVGGAASASCSAASTGGPGYVYIQVN